MLLCHSSVITILLCGKHLILCHLTGYFVSLPHSLVIIVPQITLLFFVNSTLSLFLNLLSIVIPFLGKGFCQS